MKLAEYIEAQPFALKPRDMSPYDWKQTLRGACTELQLPGEKVQLWIVISYLKSVTQMREDVQHSIDNPAGVPELYWFHKIRVRQKESTHKFSPHSLRMLAIALHGKIDLLLNAGTDPSEYRARAIAFMDAWQIELDATNQRELF